MDSWLRNKLQEASDPAKCTHRYGVTRSAFSVGIDDQRNFWINYCDAVADGHNPYISELVGDRETVQLGFDLKLSFERQQIPYQSEFVTGLSLSIDNYIQHVVGTIQTMMLHHFERSQHGSEFVACYLRREDDRALLWHDNNVDYNGRIVFPYAKLKREYLPRFAQLVQSELQINSDSPDKHLPVPPLNGLDTLIQPTGMQTVEMYGSSLNDDSPPFKLAEIYGYLNNDVKVCYELGGVFVPTLHSAVTQGILPHEIIHQRINERGIHYWLPLFFSNGFYDTPMKPVPGVITANEVPQITLDVIRQSGESLTKLERARQLLNLLSPKRVATYASWIDIGYALYSIDSGKEGLRLWKWVTSNPHAKSIRSEDDCEMQWNGFESGSAVDHETLDYFAKLDNPEKYATFVDRENEEIIDKAIFNQEHTPVAKAFKACYPHQFVCANYEKAEWFYYENHRWVHMDGESGLMLWMNEKFQNKLEKIRADISVKVASSRDSEFKTRTENKIAMITELIKKLSQNGYKRELCRELKIYYHKPQFYRLKDALRDCKACPNGVLDFRSGKREFRPGKPQDYITKCTRYNYPENYHWGHKAVTMTMGYLSQVFRINRLRDCAIRFFASLMRSGNADKIFPIFSGEGNNSKSILVRILESALGSYAVKLPTSLITEKRTGADQATPSLIHSQGAAAGFLEEPNPKEVIQSGTVKHITGKDTMYVRDLFQKGSAIIELDVSIVPILIANKIPVIPDCQEAIWNRTRVFHFGSKWSSHAPADPAEQMRQGIFPMDKFFDRNIPIMAPAFLWIMAEKFEEYIQMGLAEPPEVMEATENFRVANNFYIHFTRDCVKQEKLQSGEPDLQYRVTLDELFLSFKKWYADQQFRAKMPTKTEFKENIEVLWKTKCDHEYKWYGVRLLTAATNISSLLVL